MIEPGFYERIDLEAARAMYFEQKRQMPTPELALSVEQIGFIIEAALVGVQPATVEERGRMFPDPNRKGILVHRTTDRRLVSEWKPVGEEET